MTYQIKKAAVLGAGVMGATIAAHLANAGIETLLLDIVPFELKPADEAKGLTKESPAWRNSFAERGLKGAIKSKPASFYSKQVAKLVKTGNFDDDLEKLAGVDWVIEVVVENLEIKQSLLAKVEKIINSNCILSSNTSGLPINEVGSKLSAAVKERFLGTHFFNPPRYMKLLEIIPGPKTTPEVIDFVSDFCENVLGKGIVVCNDVPNFIANRIGVFDIANAMTIMLEKGLTISELDAIIGKALGRPGSAICGTMDLVGLDTGMHVMQHLFEAAVDDEKRDIFNAPDFMVKMVKDGRLGNKTRQGFYKKTKDESGKRVKLVLDYNTGEYVAFQKPRFDVLKEARKTPGGFKASLKFLFASPGKVGDVVRAYLCNNFLYAANRIPEISDRIDAIDNAMKWGYNHKLGPFELWDAIGIEATLPVFKSLKMKLPKALNAMLKAGFKSFYEKREDGLYVFDFAGQKYEKIAVNPKIVLLPSLKSKGGIVVENEGAALIDLGDGIACVEFSTKMNSIDANVVGMLNQACDLVEKDFKGLVVANHGANFSVGANLFEVFVTIQKGDWDILDAMIKGFQDCNMRLKYLEKPVVVAPAGMALGGGCEISMHGDYCLAAGETYMGLVEVGVGVIPAGGGVKELMIRTTEGIPDGTIASGLNMQTYYQNIFETIGMAKVATSAIEAKEFGFIRKNCAIAINRDHQIYDAKQIALGLSHFYKKPVAPMIPVMGDNFKGMLDSVLYNMRAGNFISDYDLHVATKLAGILSGGDCAEGTYVSEQLLLDLEREAFLSLCGEAKTQDRIIYMLKNNKPLRN